MYADIVSDMFTVWFAVFLVCLLADMFRSAAMVD